MSEPLTVARQLIASPLVAGRIVAGEEIAFQVDLTLVSGQRILALARVP